MKNYSPLAAAAALALWLVPLASQAQILYGTTFFDNQLIAYSTADGSATQVGVLGTNISPYGIANRSGVLYTFDPNSDAIRMINPTTEVAGAPISIGVPNLGGEGDIAFRSDGIGFLSSALNPTTFAITDDLYSFNLANGTSTRVGTTTLTGVPITVDAMAFSPNGTLFALGQGEGRLFTVNTTTAVMTVVGELTVTQNSPFAALTFAPNGTLYGAIDDVLYTINTTTGAATVVPPGNGTNFGSVSGLAFWAVPEPTTIGLLSVGALLLGRRRRK